jgi:predicted enzyme related to lactoylglutathione lyase
MLRRHDDVTNAPGTFCNARLHTPDIAAATRFYGAVFGWEIHDDNGTPSFLLRGERVAGIRRTDDAQSLWVPYVAVESVGVTRDAAARAGGTVIEAFSQPGPNHAAVIKDPEGAVFGLCAPDASDIATLTDGPGTIWWVEVLTNTPDVLMQFYGGLLRWYFTEQALAPHPRYVTWMRGEQPVGGLLPIGRDWSASPRWQVLFQVDDLEASVAHVVAAGGNVEFGPLNVPKAGTLTSVRDPQGALHVLVQPRQVTT